MRSARRGIDWSGNDDPRFADLAEQIRRANLANMQQKPGIDLRMTAAGKIFWIMYAGILVGLLCWKLR